MGIPEDSERASSAARTLSDSPSAVLSIACCSRPRVRPGSAKPGAKAPSELLDASQIVLACWPFAVGHKARAMSSVFSSVAGCSSTRRKTEATDGAFEIPPAYDSGVVSPMMARSPLWICGRSWSITHARLASMRRRR